MAPRPALIAVRLAFALALALALLVLAPLRAHAQQAVDASTKARSLNAVGLELHRLGRYDEAVAAYREAYALAPTPALLFNIAQSLRLAGPDRCDDAARHYRDYLAAAPDAPNRDQVERLLATLEPCGPSSQPTTLAAAPPPTPSPGPVPLDPPRLTRASRRGAITLGIVGAAAIATGATLWVIADREYAALEDECGDGDCPPSRWQTYQTVERVGYAMMAAGAVAGAGALAWWLLTPDERPAASTATWVAPTAGGLVVGGAF